MSANNAQADDLSPDGRYVRQGTCLDDQHFKAWLAFDTGTHIELSALCMSGLCQLLAYCVCGVCV